jgi:hypothetical protein
MKHKLYLLLILSFSSINAAEADDPTAALKKLCLEYNQGAKAGTPDPTLESALLRLTNNSVSALATRRRSRQGSLSSLDRAERRKSIEFERECQSPSDLLREAGIDSLTCIGLIVRRSFNYEVTTYFETFTDRQGKKHFGKDTKLKTFIGFQIVRSKK